MSLVCMPWHALDSPSIQLGTLQALLADAGIPCRSHSLYLEFLEFLRTAGSDGQALLSAADYQQIGDFLFLLSPGEWVFAVPPVRPLDRGEDRRYLKLLRGKGVSNRLVKRLQLLRARIAAFLAASAAEILASGARVVGFTTTFGQTVASLALAAAIRQRDPGVAIVFGGANCEGSMGAALQRAYRDWIDVVVRGEAELVLPELTTALLAGEPVPRLPGLCFSVGGAQVVVEAPATPRVAMDDVPTPDYDEYFDRLSRSRSNSEIVPNLPFESSRGCWWGEQSQCTFCGLNGAVMRHRAKSPARAVDELLQLADRYQALDFRVVDNILDQGYLTTMLPDLRDRRLDLRLFCQTKANLSRAHLRLLRDAGVTAIRPGIESLSTPILRAMRKGVTALQNIRLLKWCAEYGLHAAWNLLYGLPGEAPAWYERMARLLPALVHLPPPRLSPLTLDRFSPYHEAPQAHGIEVLGPPRQARALHDLPAETLGEIAWTFEYALPAGQRPEAYVAELAEQVQLWRREWSANRGALTYRHGPSFLVLEDRRTTLGDRRFVLDAFEAKVYLSCDAGRDLAGIVREPGLQGEATRVQAVLDELVAERLAYEEDGTFLSLALPATPRADRDDLAEQGVAADCRSPTAGSPMS